MEMHSDIYMYIKYLHNTVSTLWIFWHAFDKCETNQITESDLNKTSLEDLHKACQSPVFHPPKYFLM